MFEGLSLVGSMKRGSCNPTKRHVKASKHRYQESCFRLLASFRFPIRFPTVYKVLIQKRNMPTFSQGPCRAVYSFIEKRPCLERAPISSMSGLGMYPHLQWKPSSWNMTVLRSQNKGKKTSINRPRSIFQRFGGYCTRSHQDTMIKQSYWELLVSNILILVQRVQVPNISGLWFQKPYHSWLLGPEPLNIGYLDPLG